MQKGTVNKQNEEKAFGFIKPNKKGKGIFFHNNDYNRKFKPPEIGLNVNDSQDDTGRKCVIHVSPITGQKKILEQKSS